MKRHYDWIDNADSFICPECGFECNNPLYYSDTATCPTCGFTPAKYTATTANLVYDKLNELNEALLKYLRWLDVAGKCPDKFVIVKMDGLIEWMKYEEEKS